MSEQKSFTFEKPNHEMGCIQKALGVNEERQMEIINNVNAKINAYREINRSGLSATEIMEMVVDNCENVNEILSTMNIVHENWERSRNPLAAMFKD